ncbi:GFA family protein [Parasalinivibrio latis]|uniref:GFA family protein n=1 Tax=Parasalinivibrio latis TaxID=2952610 RepID=UPI0030DE3579
MSLQIKGGCLCGAIRYRSNAVPAFSVICQCSQCQKITGTGHSAAVVVEADTLMWTGKCREYVLESDSGSRVVTAFCPACGCPIYKATDGYPQWRFINVGSLDDPGEFNADMVVYHESGHTWDVLPAHVPVFGRVPENGV